MNFRRQLLVIGALLVTLPAICSQNKSTQVYRVEAVGPVEVSLPIKHGVDRVMYRDGSGAWQSVAGKIEDGVLHATFDLANLATGQTMIMVGAPIGVDLTDQTPPYVESLKIDGVEFGPVNSVRLGGVDRAPKRIELKVYDEQNWLTTASIRLTVNGKSFRPGRNGFTFERDGMKAGTLHIADLHALMGPIQEQNTVTLQIDDNAVDDANLNFSLLFSYTQPHHLADGRIAMVDSIVGSAAWDEWWVVFDGVKMDTSYTSTADVTWLSEGSDLPHWIRVDFPEERTVSGVNLWWAYYSGYRTSQHFLVQTWHNDRWVTQAELSDQAQMQMSEIIFDGVKTTAVRVWQPPMKGCALEPEYMWLSEIEFRK